ncbi:hypothetical protein [Clostridium butyricum]|uniref:hypothetical protein n=1 Tax=Clostridium butyricum TaxID=1492 RepID=UPI0018AA2BC4|nr:hypothetical protein [Clostridium butyricum]MDB2157215.1 hypothetical protein [Clostridium butyricum]
MQLFNRINTLDFIPQQNLNIKNIIEKLTNEEICNSSLDDLEDYFLNEFKLNLIEVETDINFITHDAQETKVKQYNPWYRRGGYDEKEYYLVDGYKIIYKIPFEGDVDLLYLHPSHSIMSKFEVDNIINPTEEKEGQIIFSQTYERNSITSQENMIEFITREFNSKFSSYFQMINYINNDIHNFNSTLESTIKKHLEERLKKAEDYLKLREKLNIPLALNNNAPNIKPVRLKKVKKNKNSSLPKLKSSPIEYGISDDDYNNIKNIINLSCISMEKAARTFCKLHEEELRDVILASLNTHYMGSATGETFNKRGKTDIHIPFENKSAYIGECKIWTGQGLFTEAIDQLFSYMRWRDTKTSLIIFNKTRKDFSKILSTIDTILSEHNLCINKMKISNNEWQCNFKKDSESTEIVNLNIVIYDLFIES